MSTRIEIVHSDAIQPWFARIIATNGEEVWRTSETYADRESAVDAVRFLVEQIGLVVNGGGTVGIDQGVGPGDHPFFTIDGFTASPMLYPVDERDAHVHEVPD